MGDTTYLTKNGVLHTYHKQKTATILQKAKRVFKTIQGAILNLPYKDHKDSEMTATIQGKLTADEAQALRRYSGSAYTGINNYLNQLDSNGQNAYEKGDTTSKLYPTVKMIDQATDKKINKPLYLYRGENIEFVENILGRGFKDSQLSSLIGKVVAFKGFASTAYVADRSFHSKPVFLQIDAPKGVRGRVITDVSAFGTDEAELLLHNSGGLHIKKVRRDKSGQIIIETEYVY